MKEQREAYRRKQILEAATIIFGEKGFHNAKIAEIANAANIGKGTVYQYYRSKNELVEATLEYMMEEFDKKILELIIIEQSYDEKIKALVKASVEQLYQLQPIIDLNLISLLYKLPKSQQIINKHHQRWAIMIEDIIKDGVAKGELRSIDPQVFTSVLFGVMFNMCRPWAFGMRNKLDKEGITKEIVTLIMNGISVKKIIA